MIGILRLTKNVATRMGTREPGHVNVHIFFITAVLRLRCQCKQSATSALSAVSTFFETFFLFPTQATAIGPADARVEHGNC